MSCNKIKTICVLAILSLTATACAPVYPIDKSLLLPNEKAYSQMQKNSFLSGKLALADIQPKTTHTRLNSMLGNATLAAQVALSQGGFLSKDQHTAKYIISGIIKDVGTPSGGFGYLETGSTIEYSIIRASDRKVVWNDTLVVPFTQDYAAFGSNMDYVMVQAIGGAVANNYAHLIQVLSLKRERDFK